MTMMMMMMKISTKMTPRIELHLNIICSAADANDPFFPLRSPAARKSDRSIERC